MTAYGMRKSVKEDIKEKDINGTAVKYVRLNLKAASLLQL
jgi:hypothetical protein